MDFGVDTMMDYGSGATFSATASNFSQPFEDPFGDAPFRATPSTDTNPTQSQNPPSYQPTMNQGLEVLPVPAQSALPHTETLTNFDYGTPFGDVTYTQSAVSDDQFSAVNAQIVPQGFHDQETDILAGILPPTGFVDSPARASLEIDHAFPGQSFQSDNAFGGYHQQSGAPPMTSQFTDQAPTRQAALISNDFFSQQGITASSQPRTDSQFATHIHNQTNGGDFFRQLGSSVPASAIPYGQTEPNSHKYDDGSFLQQSGSTMQMQVTSAMTPGSGYGESMQHCTNGTISQPPGFSLGSLPMASQGQKEPDVQNHNEGFHQQSASSVSVMSQVAPPPNPHHDGGGFIQQHSAPQMAPQVLHDQNSQNLNGGFFHQQLASTAPGAPHMAPGFSYPSTAQQHNGGFLQQPASSQWNPHINSQQPGSPQIAPQGQKEQNPLTRSSDLHQLSAPASAGTSLMGPGSPYAPNSLGNLPTNPQQPSSVLVGPQGLKEQNSQNYGGGFPNQQSASTATGAPHMVPGSSYPSNAQQIQLPGLALGNSPMNHQGQIESTAQNHSGGMPQQKQESHVIPGRAYGATGQYNAGNFLPSSGLAQFSPHHAESVLNQYSSGLGGLVSQSGTPNQITSQHSASATAGPHALAPQPTKDKFETKSTVWADTLSRGLVNLNISGSKTNPLADIGIDFDAINRKEKRMEKPAATPVVSTVTMGKAMGSGSGIGRAGALRPSTSPMMNSGMNSTSTGPGFGPGPIMSGFGGMNQQPMGGFGSMNQQQAMGGFGVMNQPPPPMGGLGGMNQQQMGSYGGMNQQSMGMGFGPGTGMRPGIGMGPGPGVSMNVGMNLSMGQGGTMQQPTGMPSGSSYNGGYNPMMGGGYPSQQSYGGGYR
uniref:Uncharacterized protein n=1 Tax=Kalanchoe fedtschenkoi TaxID=63787 RepID=A0A7N0TW25_KALFE